MSLDNEEEYISEFGCSAPIRFLDESMVTLSDGEGNEIVCACGEKATTTIVGKESYKGFCSSCLYGESK